MKPMDANATHHKFDRVISQKNPFTPEELSSVKYGDYVTGRFKLVIEYNEFRSRQLKDIKEEWESRSKEEKSKYFVFLSFDLFIKDLFPIEFSFRDGEVISYNSRMGIVECTVKLEKSFYQMEKERIAGSEKWVGALQSVCTFDHGSWSIHCPFGGFSFPNRKDICTILNDGSPMLRFKVAKDKQGRPTFKLFQYRFRNSDLEKANKTDAKGNKYSLYTSKCINSFRRWVQSCGMTTNDALSFEEIAAYLKTTNKWGG